MQTEKQEKIDKMLRKDIIPEEKKGEEGGEEEEDYEDDDFEVDGDVKGNHTCHINMIVAEMCNMAQTDCEAVKVDPIVTAVLEAKEDYPIGTGPKDIDSMRSSLRGKQVSVADEEIIAVPKQVRRSESRWKKIIKPTNLSLDIHPLLVEGDPDGHY